MLDNEDACNKYLMNDWFVSWIGKKNERADEEHKVTSDFIKKPAYFKSSKTNKQK